MTPKSEIVVLRVEPEWKEKTQAAANAVGKTLTTFITDAVSKEAARTAGKPAVRGVHGGVPGFFRASCRDATNGGARGYESAGWQLGRHLRHQVPLDVEAAEWDSELAVLDEAVEAGGDAVVWEWFGRHYPVCMRLVPARRRDQFVAGVRRAHQEAEGFAP